MRFWRRKSVADSTVLPQEVKDYYTAEKRERRGMAGLLAVGTLLATILIAVGLFFGGRWAYRSIRHQGQKTTSAVKTATSSTSTTTPSGNNTSSSDGSNNGATNSGGTNADGSSATTSSQSGGSSAASSTSQGTSSTTAASGTKASTGDLPKTGPEGTVAAFMAAAVGSIVVAELYQRRKFNR